MDAPPPPPVEKDEACLRLVTEPERTIAKDIYRLVRSARRRLRIS